MFSKIAGILHGIENAGTVAYIQPISIHTLYVDSHALYTGTCTSALADAFTDARSHPYMLYEQVPSFKMPLGIFGNPFTPFGN